MKRSTKKGFTIVELVIVIAIIAILAAVLIPTFASLIQKANESKDTQLVKNLNTALAADNKEHKTMQDALDAAVEFGYDVGKINASATGNEILWDSKNDVFCYLKDGKVEYIPETSLKNGAVADDETYKLWKIYDKASDVPDTQKYSIYWNSTENFGKNLTVGFDAGTNSTITALTYKGVGTAQIVTIRTNGGTLTVNAPADTVYHYGDATVVTVTEVANAFYHEYGKVDEIKLAKGRVVVESDGEVGSVMVTASAATDVAVENKSGKLGGVAASKSDVASNLKNQVTGVDESKVLTTAVDNSKFAGGLGTEDAPYLIATAEQFKSIADYSSQMKSGNSYCFKLISNINLGELSLNKTAISEYFCGVFDGNGKSLTTNNGLNSIFADSVDKVIVKDLYYVLNGEHVISLFGGMVCGKGLPDITYDNVDVLNTEGAGKVILYENEGLFAGWTGSSQNTKQYGSFSNDKRIKLTIKNCDVKADIIGYSYNAIFIGGGLYFTDAVVENCTYTGNFVGDKVNLVLGNTSPWNSTISITNVTNKGTISSTVSVPKIAGGAYQAGDVYGNESRVVNSTTSTNKLSINITNCSIGTANTFTEKYLSVNANGSSKIGCQITAKQASNETVDYYLLTLVGGKRIVSSNSENSSYRLNIKIAKNDLTETIKNFKTGEFVAKQDMAVAGLTDNDLSNAKSYSIYGEGENDKVYLVEKDGAFYYVCDFEVTNNFQKYFTTGDDINIHGKVGMTSIELTAYASDNTPVGKSTVKWNNSAWN